MAQDFRETSPDDGSCGFQQWVDPLAASMQSSNVQLRSLSPLALAYIGDAVYELFVRSRLLMPSRQIRVFHREVVDHVRAEQQALYLECLRPHLSETEIDILRRARNATSGRKARASLRDYRQATALEALLGYLYLSDPQRLMEVLAYLPIASESLPTPSV